MKELAFVLLTTVTMSSALAETPWFEIQTGGATTCARGAPYSFFVFPGDNSKVIVDFIGGGACWDAATCAPESATFSDNIDDIRREAMNPQGVYRRNHPDNPYRDWTHIVVPYCTGDIHWGDNEVAYKRSDGSEFTIHHRGATNTRAVLAWMREHHPNPSNVVVQGCSAGAYGSIFWTPHVAEQHPQAKLTQFGDSGAGVLGPNFLANAAPLWNVNASVPRWIPDLDPSQIDFSGLQLTDLYERVARYYPFINFAQFNHADDIVQRIFLSRMGGDPNIWGEAMQASQRLIRAKANNYRYYIAPSDEHCITIIDQFYETQSDGVDISDWLKGHIEGQAQPDVSCTNCGIPTQNR